MSDNEAPKGKAAAGWTDRERLAYLVSLLEHSDVKLNFKTAPLPAGRTVIACERMVGRLKTALKTDLDALRAGVPMSVSDNGKGTPKKTATPRKRKAKGEDEGSPVKKGGRGKKGEVAAVEDEEVVKDEVKEEEETEI